MSQTDRPAAPDGAGVTFLGVGRMGEAMVERLLAGGVGVAAWNRTPARLDGVVGRGASALAAPAGSAAPVAISMVLDDAALDALWQRPDGLLSGPTPPAVWLDCSTVSVAASSRAAAAAASSNVDFVCAPVSGNPGVVRAGNLIFAASGPAPAVARVLPLLDVIGRRTLVVGDAHQARVVKLCVNAVLAIHAQALAEALVLAERNGVRRSALMEFINDSAVGSPFTRYKTDAFVGLDLTPAFTPEGQRKDLRLALGLAAEGEVPLPLVSATEVIYSRLVASGLGAGKDFAALLLLAARDAGLELEPEAG
ncbi:MAG TPA: NAD(P)-dependent oxidoreductase [Mycobacteriales bacterium]|nr:NAD(P)-dependent oxidoreductase [Mycobacteriales bacterium]